MKRLLQGALRPEAVSVLQDIVRFNERWKQSAQLERDFYSSLKRTTIITSTGASTRIEGARLSDEEIIDRLDRLRIKRIQDRDEAEVAGYIECLEYVFDSFETLTISEHCIRSLHQMMCQYLPGETLPQNQRGAYKSITNAVIRIDHETRTEEVIFETTPPGPQTEAAMAELIKDYSAYISDTIFPDLVVISAFILKFLAIHPFRDGNGRMSRLLTNLCLLQAGYRFCMYSSHEKAIEDYKEAYYLSLRQTQGTLKHEQPDLNPWLVFFLKALQRQAKALENKIIPIGIGSLTQREDQVVQLIRKHQPVTIGFLERETGIKRVTLKAILRRLKEQKVIRQEGSTKASRYLLPK